MTYQFSGKRMLVTGASSGLGAALARQLAGRGPVVGLAARRVHRPAAVLAGCGAASPEFQMYVAVAVIARFEAQQRLAREFGAVKVLAHEPRLAIIEELVGWGGGRLRRPLLGLPMAYPGAVDVVYDTVGKPETFEVGVRVLTARETLVKAGVHAPGRWEWSPLYFKEINWVGSNAFGCEELGGVRKHAIEHYLDLASSGRIDLRPMLTHTFRLEQWRDAFLAIAEQGHSGAVKVAID